MSPCGACREFMMQMSNNSRDIEVLVNNDGKVVKLGDLMPEYPY